MKILSFNIRCANDPDGHSIPERAPRVAEILREQAPDIIGLQEYHLRWDASWPVVEQPDYEAWKIDRGDGEGLVLMWRKDGFRVLKKGHFWFGDDPGASSTDWDEKYHKPRICGYAVLEDKKTGKVFTYMNVHYGFGDAGQIKNARLLHTFAQKLGSYPTIISGDFNMEPGSAGHQAMIQGFTDATGGNTHITFHGYGNCPGRVLDHCFVTPEVAPQSFQIIPKTFDGKYPSDHYPIAMHVEI